jgi:type II secretion system protein N
MRPVDWVKVDWAKWKKPLAYGGLWLVSFFFFLFVTFPYETLKQVVILQAQEQGLKVRVGSLGPGFFGVTASNVQLSTGEDTQSLRVDSVAVRPSLFPLGVALRARALDGTIKGAVGLVGDLAVRVTASNVDFSKGNLKGLTGVDLAGKASADVSLDIPQGPTSPSGKDRQPNLSHASGTISLTADGLLVKGGNVTVPLYGQMTPMDLPRLQIGSLEAALKFDKGTGTVEKLQSHGGDLELLVSGSLKLGRQLLYSEPNLQVRLKPEPALTNSFIGLGISALPPDPQNPAFRSARMTGYLGTPNFMPGI